jgi:hypothetical protein
LSGSSCVFLLSFFAISLHYSFPNLKDFVVGGIQYPRIWHFIAVVN